MLPSGDVVWAPYGNFGRRLLSWAIDWGAFLVLPSVLVDETWLLAFLMYLTLWVARGRTIGMKITGLRIAREDNGDIPGYWTAFLRYLRLFGAYLGVGFSAFLVIGLVAGVAGVDEGNVVEIATGVFVTGPFAVGYVKALQDPKQQNLLDRASGLVVVRVPPEHDRFFRAREQGT